MILAPHFFRPSSPASCSHADPLAVYDHEIREKGDEDDPETGVQSSFRVERPTAPRAVTLFQLRETFPFAGEFHFRLKVMISKSNGNRPLLR